MHGLVNAGLGVETYCLTYSSVDELLHILDTVIMDGEANFRDSRSRQGLRIAGMSNIDDFTMITPVELSLISRIWPEKVTNHVCFSVCFLMFSFVLILVYRHSVRCNPLSTQGKPSASRARYHDEALHRAFTERNREIEHDRMTGSQRTFFTL